MFYCGRRFESRREGLGRLVREGGKVKIFALVIVVGNWVLYFYYLLDGFYIIILERFFRGEGVRYG